MTVEVPPHVLKGAKALVVGVANQHSIAYGCAKAFAELGAELAITYVNEKTKTYVEPLARELGAPIFMQLDVATPGMLEAVFDTITWETENARWERGGVVWSFTCQRCHGSDGKGHGPDATNFDMAVPDITAADWPYAGDIPAIRERIFVGHDSEMPSMGLIGLTYRDVDASAHYIDDLLRTGP